MKSKWDSIKGKLCYDTWHGIEGFAVRIVEFLDGRLEVCLESRDGIETCDNWFPLERVELSPELKGFNNHE